eukprot:1833302-Lingulodinium_polyedra.AAC.1
MPFGPQRQGGRPEPPATRPEASLEPDANTTVATWSRGGATAWRAHASGQRSNAWSPEQRRRRRTPRGRTR